jgi:hypothetical protein
VHSIYLNGHFHLGFLNVLVILLRGDHRHVSAIHVQDGKNKNTNICTVCLDHFTVKTRIVCLKLRSVKWYSSDEYKILEVKIC